MRLKKKKKNHMQRIGLHDTGLCSKCYVREVEFRYLFVCPKYIHQKSILKNDLKKSNIKFTLQILLDPQAT